MDVISPFPEKLLALQTWPCMRKKQLNADLKIVLYVVSTSLSSREYLLVLLSY